MELILNHKNQIFFKFDRILIVKTIYVERISMIEHHYG